MYVKQIGMEEALRLAGNGREIMVMVPGIEGENGWRTIRWIHWPGCWKGVCSSGRNRRLKCGMG